MDIDGIGEALADEIAVLVAPLPSAAARLPGRLCGDLSDQLDGALVLEVAQPISDGIDLGLGREFVDVGLMREGVRHRRYAPEPGCPRDRGHVVDDDAMVVEIIRTDGGAIAHLRDGGRRSDLSREQERERRRRVRRIARREIVGGDAALGVEPAVDVHELAGALGLPLMLLIAG